LVGTAVAAIVSFTAVETVIATIPEQAVVAASGEDPIVAGVGKDPIWVVVSDEDVRSPPCGRLDPSRTILGDDQEQWLRAGLAGSTARWNALAQQVFFSQRDFTAGDTDSFSDDAWDNYVADRDGLRDHIAAVSASNPVVLTGDVHAHYLCDVKANFEDPASATVATEIVGTFISTGGDGVENTAGDAVQFAENPHIKFINRKRGYVRNVVTPDTWTADFRTVDFVRTKGAPITTRASFVIENGHPGGIPA
jgi:alkaline phosphatase D